MPQKTYAFPAKDGSTTTKTLAPPTNDRMVKMLSLLGKKSYSELVSTEQLLEKMIVRLDLAIKGETMTAALETCLQEGIGDLELKTLDLRLFDEVIQDFFEQRSKSLSERFLS